MTEENTKSEGTQRWTCCLPLPSRPLIPFARHSCENTGPFQLSHGKRKQWALLLFAKSWKPRYICINALEVMEAPMKKAERLTSRWRHVFAEESSSAQTDGTRNRNGARISRNRTSPYLSSLATPALQLPGASRAPKIPSSVTYDTRTRAYTGLTFSSCMILNFWPHTPLLNGRSGLSESQQLGGGTCMGL